MMKRYLFAGLFSLVLILWSPTSGGQTMQNDPSPVQAVAPAYPRIAAAAGASGTVVVEVQLNVDGTVSELRTVEGVGALAAAGEDAALRWKFGSASDQKNRSVRLTFIFNIMPRATPKHQLLPMFLPPYRVEVRATVPELIDSVNRDPSTSRQSSRSPKKRP
jgi:TonB family protein